MDVAKTLLVLALVPFCALAAEIDHLMLKRADKIRSGPKRMSKEYWDRKYAEFESSF
jgi:hypothetical protein